MNTNRIAQLLLQEDVDQFKQQFAKLIDTKIDFYLKQLQNDTLKDFGYQITKPNKRHSAIEQSDIQCTKQAIVDSVIDHQQSVGQANEQLINHFESTVDQMQLDMICGETPSVPTLEPKLEEEVNSRYIAGEIDTLDPKLFAEIEDDQQVEKLVKRGLLDLNDHPAYKEQSEQQSEKEESQHEHSEQQSEKEEPQSVQPLDVPEHQPVQHVKPVDLEAEDQSEQQDQYPFDLVDDQQPSQTADEQQEQQEQEQQQESQPSDQQPFSELEPEQSESEQEQDQSEPEQEKEKDDQEEEDEQFSSESESEQEKQEENQQPSSSSQPTTRNIDGIELVVD